MKTAVGDNPDTYQDLQAGKALFPIRKVKTEKAAATSKRV